MVLQSSGAAVQLGHVGKVSVLLARQELLQMDLEFANVTNLPRKGVNTASCDKPHEERATEHLKELKP